jgi:hypothetical protein
MPTRSFGQPPWHSASTGQRRHWAVNVARLASSERPLARVVDERGERRVEQVPEPVGALDVVVAGVDVAGVLERQGVAADGLMDADPGRHAQVLAEQVVEGLHEHLSDVAADPGVEDGEEEAPERRSRHAPLGERGPALRARRVRPLDDRDELQEARAGLVAQEAVDVEGRVDVAGVDGGEGVPLDLVAAQHLDAAHDRVEGAAAALVVAVAVVQVARTVEADPHQEAVAGEERAPGVVEPRPVGLQRVLDALVRPPPRSANATARSKKSRPISVGSPPCQAKVTSVPGWAASVASTKRSSTASDMRKEDPG